MNDSQFDRLPYLAMKHVFKLLNLRDLTRCRAVCRRFKFYADQVKVDQLVVSDRQDWPECCWHLTERSIDHEGLISWKEFATIKPSQFNLHQRLKFLHVSLDQTFGFSSLNSFKQLLHLELYLEGSDARTRKLTLSELRVLKLDGVRSTCVLKTPKLEVLSCRFASDLRFEHPETIKWFESYNPTADFMRTFENLEVFKSHISTVFDLHPNLLSAWRNLRELDIKDPHLFLRSDRELNSSLVNALRQRKISRREEPKCFLNDVQLVNESQLEDYRSMNYVDFQFKHYRLLRGARLDVLEVNYNDLIGLAHELSDDFFDKFPNIQKVEATGAVEREKFEEFLKNVSKLIELRLTNTALDQAFADNLPNINDRLTDLAIFGSCLANFNFILQFRLRKFKTDQPFEGSFDLAAKAFRRPGFCRFQFREDDELIRIDKPLPDRDTYDLKFHKLASSQIRIVLSDLEWAELISFWKQRKKPETGCCTARDAEGRKRFKAGP